ncbi:MAG TPA: helix-turn-helix domain-containing protein [Pseudonocardiaceae bacterium]|jgi:excisionase family DNA binding protein|nr:helix-turn-helix domain-containing protein [Pseudonocardiaceae bacterium]
MNNTVTSPDEVAPHKTNTLVLTINEACAALRISKWTLYQLMNAKQLDYIRIRRRRLIPRTALQEFVNRLSAEDVT